MKKLLTLLTIISLALFSFTMPQKYVTVLLVTQDNDDQTTVTSIRTSLMAAEKVAGVMGVELIASDETVDDVFVFALDSDEQKEMTLEMFDEEGYEMVAQNTLSVTEGSNYRALNLKSLEDGTYIFKLTDEAGNEIQKQIKKH